MTIEPHTDFFRRFSTASNLIQRPPDSVRMLPIM